MFNLCQLNDFHQLPSRDSVHVDFVQFIMAEQSQPSQELPVVDERLPGSAALEAMKSMLGTYLILNDRTTAFLMAAIVFSIIGLSTHAIHWTY